MSYFLALLIKMGAAGEANRSAIGGLLVPEAVNVFLVLAVLGTAWFATRWMGDSAFKERKTSDEDNIKPRTMLTVTQDLPTASS